MNKLYSEIPNIRGVPIASIGKQNHISGLQYVMEKSMQDTSWHCHDTALLFCLESGLFGVRTESKAAVLAPGMICYMPPNFPHFEQGFGTVVSGWLLTIPEERARVLPPISCVMEISPLLMELCRRVVSWGEQEQRTPEQERIVSTLLDELQLAEQADYLFIPFPKRANLRLLAKQIMNHPEDMNSVAHWAKRAGMSKRSFSRIFSQETGVSFVLWRQRVKLHSALVGLSEGKSVSDIAFDLGYRNLSTFIAIFKKQFGVSPRKYMKQKALPQNRPSNGCR